MGFSEELIKNRKAAKLTQEQLAEKCNVSRQAIAKWEKGESLPDVYTIADLASLFGITIEELIRSKDDALAKNGKYYVRNLQDTDKSALEELMREHKGGIWGFLFQKLRQIYEDKSWKFDEDGTYWNMFRNDWNTYLVCLCENQKAIGYFCINEIETSAPHMYMVFNSKMILDDAIVELTKTVFNKLSIEFRLKAAVVDVNAELEQKILAALGYVNATDQVLIAFPV